MIIGQIIDNDSEIKDYVKMLIQLDEQEFMRKMNLLTNSAEQLVDDEVLKLFQYHCHKDMKMIKECLSMEGLTSDRIDMFLKQFQLWKERETSQRSVEISEREQLLDLQWKLNVRSGGSYPTDESIYVQIALLVKKDNKLKTHHLEMEVPMFYDFLHKLTNGNETIQELLKG